MMAMITVVARCVPRTPSPTPTTTARRCPSFLCQVADAKSLLVFSRRTLFTADELALFRLYVQDQNSHVNPEGFLVLSRDASQQWWMLVVCGVWRERCWASWPSCKMIDSVTMFFWLLRSFRCFLSSRVYTPSYTSYWNPIILR